MHTALQRTTLCAIIVLSTLGCVDPGPTGVPQATDADLHRGSAHGQGVPTSVIWNERAVTLLERNGVTSNTVGNRLFVYLSLAQYQAARKAERVRHGAKRPSIPAATGAASVAVLSSFFPASADSLEAQLDQDLEGVGRRNWRREDVGAGEAIGRSVAAEVLGRAATDHTNAESAGEPPTGPGFWVSSGAPLAQGLYRARPFFIPPGSDLGTPPPPAFGSPEFVEDLAEVRQISDTRTPEQTELAQFWNRQPPPGIAQLNLIADELLRDRRRYDRERDAAELLFRANAAVFDAQIACYESKFQHWFLRPVHADPAITMVIGLSNHPSYPSTHACITSAYLGVLAAAFPSDRRELATQVEEAGLSRLYGGIHYRFDITSGQKLGRRAAIYALHGRIE